MYIFLSTNSLKKHALVSSHTGTWNFYQIIDINDNIQKLKYPLYSIRNTSNHTQHKMSQINYQNNKS